MLLVTKCVAPRDRGSHESFMMALRAQGRQPTRKENQMFSKHKFRKSIPTLNHRDAFRELRLRASRMSFPP